MRTAAARPIEACLLDLLQHFGIERAHIAAGGPPPLKDWHSLATLHPERVASLTLISPPMLDTAPLAGLASRILIVAGDRGLLADGAASSRTVSRASRHTFCAAMNGYLGRTSSPIEARKSVQQCSTFSIAIRSRRSDCPNRKARSPGSPTEFEAAVRR